MATTRDYERHYRQDMERIDLRLLHYDRLYEEYIYKRYGGKVVEEAIYLSRKGRDYMDVHIPSKCYDRRYDMYPDWTSIEEEIPKPQKSERTNSMNLTTAVLLMDSRCRAVIGVYEPEKKDKDGNVTNVNCSLGPNRRMFKTFDPSIKVDSLVLVPSTTRHKLTVVKIVAVDVEPDFESSEKVDWIVGTVNLENYDDLKAQEEAVLKKIQDKEKLRKKMELLKTMSLTEEDVTAMMMNPKGLTALENKSAE